MQGFARLFWEGVFLKGRERHQPTQEKIAGESQGNEASPQQAAGYHKEGRCL